MDNAVLIEIEQLRRASLGRLRERFEEIFGEPTRCPHRAQLFRRIARRLQALAEGDLSERARAHARLLARDADLRIIGPKQFFQNGGEAVRVAPREGRRHPADARLPLPGVLLSRKSKGQMVLVEVLDRGFRYDGQQYSSLSAVACAVTGTRWNGLTFFGLNRRLEPAQGKGTGDADQRS